MPGSNARRAWLAAFVATGLLLAAPPEASGQAIRFIEVNPEHVGLASPQEAGLPDNLWQGSSPDRLAVALDVLPDGVSSAAERQALVRLLRVAAPPPAGEPVSPSLASRRLAALARLGAETDVLALADRISAPLRQAPYWQAQATVGLLRYNLAGTCALPAAAGDQTPTADWQRLAAFCRLLGGQEEAAMVAVMLADELAGDDPVFTQLFLARQFPDRPAAPSAMPATPLHLAMIRALNQPLALPAQWSETPALVASGIARYPAAGLEPRTRAAERAVAANVLPADLLVQLYLASELTTPLGTAYRQMALGQGAGGAVAAVEAFWQAAAKAGLAAQLAPFALPFAAAHPDLATLPPAFLGQALRMALAARDRAAVGLWQDALTTTSLAPAGAQARDAAYLVLALAGEPVPPVEIWWSAWLKAAQPASAKAALAAGLLRALGMPVPNAAEPKRDSAKTAKALSAAAHGEAALLALAALAVSPPPSDGLTVQAVAALAQVSPADAHAVAVELALAAGL